LPRTITSSKGAASIRVIIFMLLIVIIMSVLYFFDEFYNKGFIPKAFWENIKKTEKIKRYTIRKPVVYDYYYVSSFRSQILMEFLPAGNIIKLIDPMDHLDFETMLVKIREKKQVVLQSPLRIDQKGKKKKAPIVASIKTPLVASKKSSTKDFFDRTFGGKIVMATENHITPDDTQKSVETNTDTVDSMEIAKEIKNIRTVSSKRYEEKIIFELTSYNPPETLVIEGEKPRIVCDFLDTRINENLGKSIEINSSIVRKIRIGIHKEPKNKVRVVLDLSPQRTYIVSQLFFERENFYSLHIKVEK